MIGPIVRNHLLASPQVVALLADRLFMLVIKQGVPKPAGAITVVTDVPTNTLCGYAGLRNGRVQVDLYALDTPERGGYLIAGELATVVEEQMRQPMAGFAALCLSRVEGYDDDIEEYHVRMDFSVWSKS